MVLPDPFGPRKPKICPRATVRSMASTATKSSNFLVNPLVTMAGAAPPGLAEGAPPAPGVTSAGMGGLLGSGTAGS